MHSPLRDIADQLSGVGCSWPLGRPRAYVITEIVTPRSAFLVITRRDEMNGPRAEILAYPDALWVSIGGPIPSSTFAYSPGEAVQIVRTRLPR